MSDLILKLMDNQNKRDPSKVNLTKKCKFRELAVAVVLERIADLSCSVSFKIGPQLYRLGNICK